MPFYRTFLCIVFCAASLGTRLAPAQEARSGEEECATFTLADGFIAELVADERVMRKAVAFNFDNAGRMWVTTASDYPLDANEQPEKAAALYRDGGNDNVLIFDTPWAEGLQRPRIWAGRDKDSGNLREAAGNSARSENPEFPKSRIPEIPLAMPMGVLPYKDGAIVQHGADLLFLRDTNADGKADTREVLLTGFGIEDSHLMPHGFTRGPGDWIYFAQGAFNTSRVKTKEGAEVLVKFCKMMRMKPDGAQFEICSWGPNNIWGFAIDPRGEMWIQEANDMGYPVAPFQPGMTYPGIGDDKPKPYAPVMPPPKKLNDCTMGGTGLSGLALNEDPATWPAPWTGAFMIANPITNRIQAMRVHRDAPGYDGVKLEKLPDFLVSGDKNFRPVAIQFGPDGALYIIDWYNRIISHNEVPRAHPDRDKQRTRIWRIRAKNAPRGQVPNLTKASPERLVEHLTSANQWEANAARFELVDRRAKDVMVQLENRLLLKTEPLPARLQRLWTASLVSGVSDALASELLGDEDPNIRREAVRYSSPKTVVRPSPPWSEAHAGVRLAIAQKAIETIEAHPISASEVIKQLGWFLVDANAVGGADRLFERYVVRRTFELHPDAVRQVVFLHRLSDEDRSEVGEADLLAMLALPPPEGAARLARATRYLKRDLQPEELALLAGHVAQPVVRDAFENLLADSKQQAAILSALASIEMLPEGFDQQTLARLSTRAVRDLVQRSATADNRKLLVRLAKNLRIQELEPEVAIYVGEGGRKPEEQIEGLKALRELGSNEVDLFRRLAGEKNDGLRREAILSLASAPGEGVVPSFVELWPQLSPPLRRIALERLASAKVHAGPLVRAAKEGAIPADDLDGATLDKLVAVLGENHPELTIVLKELKGALRPVLRLSGHPGDFAETKVDLPGPFTIEAWVRLDAGVDNSDNLLGRKGGADINFHDAKLRFFANQTVRDLVIARTAIKPERWTHIAVSRDGAGRFRIYLDGELDAESESTFPEPLTGLNIGETNAGRGCAAAYTEFRVWEVARSTEEIRDNYLLSFVSMDASAPRGGLGGTSYRESDDLPKNALPGNQHRISKIEHRTSKEALPRHLVRYMSGAQGWGALKGQARIEQTRDFPELLTAADAAALATKFARYRALASDGGTAENGRALFAAVCMACHEVKGEGGKIGPTLSGAGAMGTESLLRNILTPNAQLESGYYRHDIELKSGDVLGGFLVSQHEGHIVLRQLGADDRTIARADIKKLSVAKKSLMPEGLLDGLTAEQVRDLFAYLRTLR